MDKNEANIRLTTIQTPAGQPITTDMVFDIFASLVPDSPWSARLLKIKETFNNLAAGAHMLTTIPSWNLGDQVYAVREHEGKGWHGPDVIKFNEGVVKLLSGLQALGVQPAAGTDSNAAEPSTPSEGES
jgi:hypothetical protein